MQQRHRRIDLDQVRGKCPHRHRPKCKEKAGIRKDPGLSLFLPGDTQ